MVRRLALVAAVLIGVVGSATAQTATPTETPTSTPTITPTASQQRILANQETCAAPPCTLRCLDAGGGMKTVALRVTAGTATAGPICVNGAGWLQSEVPLEPVSEAPCTAANCLFTTTAWCDQICLSVSACTDCVLLGWLRIDLYR